MRLFTALDLPAEILLPLQRLLAVLQPTAPIKWSPVENLHITTKFIGEWPEERLDQIDSTLQRLSERKPIDVTLGKLGWFPNPQSPRVLYAGIDGGEPLIELAEQTDGALTLIGTAKEDHPYTPHMTLARIKGAVPLDGLRAKVEELQEAAFGEFRAPGFYLYSSEPGSTASNYQKIRSYPFQSP